MSIDRARELNQQALALLGEARYEEALAAANEAAALVPNDAESQIQRGIALSSLGRAEEAEAAFLNAGMLSPYSAKARFNHAVHRFHQNDIKGALDLTEEALKLDPNHTSAQTLRDQLRAELGLIPASSPAPRPVITPPMEQPAWAPTPTPASAGTIDFVAKLGPAWRAIGWVLGLINLIAFSTYSRLITAYQASSTNNMDEAIMRAARDPNIQYSILGMMGTWVLIVVFAAIDIADKRASWLWLIPVGFCSCFIGWLLLPLYLLAVRKPS